MFEAQQSIVVDRLPSDVAIPKEYYDADYYAGLPKANWDMPYIWENFRPTFAVWAAFILSAFPEAKSFLDVGCAKGFLERAMIETLWRNGKPSVEITGFDMSEHAIDNAVDEARPFLVRASVDDFKFKCDYDVMVCLDLLEHLTERQVRDFLRRSRPHISDCCFFFVATDNEINRMEPSHITLRDREWWHDVFIDCGWIFDAEMMEFSTIIRKDKFIANSNSEAFVYLGGRS